MAKQLQTGILFDLYKDFLTEKQQNAVDLYYNQDLSLQEISEHLSVTRQAVRDLIKRGEQIIWDMENKLNIWEKTVAADNCIEKILQLAQEIHKHNNRSIHSEQLKDKINYMVDLLENIKRIIA